MRIPFTQFLLPDGRKRETGFTCNPEYDEKVQTLLDAGASFEAEILGMGNVSLTVEIEDRHGEHCTLAHELSENGPEIMQKVHLLIDRAHETLEEKEYEAVS